MQATFPDAVLAAGRELSVEVARSRGQLAEVLGLTGWVAHGAEDGVRPVLVRLCKTGRAVAAVRVTAGAAAPHAAWAAGHVSALAVSPDRSGLSPASAALLRLSLFRGVIGVAGEGGLTHLRAVFPPVLLRLLAATGLHFQQAGPAMDLPGAKQPVVAAIGPMLDRLRCEQPAAWRYVTDGGRLWPGVGRQRPVKAGLRFSINAVRPSV